MGRSENRDSRCVNRHRSKSRGSISPRILQARGGSAARGGHRSTVTVAAGTLRRNCQSQPKMRRRVSAVIRLGFIIRASACTPAPFHRLASPDKTKRNPTRLSTQGSSSSPARNNPFLRNYLLSPFERRGHDFFPVVHSGKDIFHERERGFERSRFRVK